MLYQTLVLASAAVAAAQSASTTESSRSTPTGSPDDEPCAIAAAYVLAEETEFSAEIAYECLQSTPVYVTGDKKLIDELKLLWQWQSEFEWYKNTPDDWERGNLDIMEALDTIKGQLDKYPSEFAVQFALQNITTQTSNYHFNYVPDILQVFNWYRPVGIASISEDGKELPKLYVESEIPLLTSDSTKKDVSDIVKIDGYNAWDYVKLVGSLEQYIDGDGQVNKVFDTGDLSTWGSFKFMSMYAGPTTKIEFANKTKVTYNNTAYVSELVQAMDWENVVDGPSFLETFCFGDLSGIPQEESALKSNGHRATRTPQKYGPPSPAHLPGSGSINYHLNKRQIPEEYTEAIVEASTGVVAGYFLEDKDYDDVAVLKITSFSPEDTDGEEGDDVDLEFQATIADFLEACIDEKKTKLIIDLRENGGGSTTLLLDAFMQLFPKQEPFSAQRYRATKPFLAMGNIIEKIHKNEEWYDAFEEQMGASLEEYYRYWAYWHFTDAQGENFKNFDAFDGPDKLNGDEFTTMFRYNYSNDDSISVRNPDFFFPNDTDRPVPFKAENVVMLTDGMCGSACASFHEELKNIAGVKSVVFGGRPEKKPMQAVLGTKGGEVVPLRYAASDPLDLMNVTAEIGAVVNVEDLKDYADIEEIYIRAGDGSSRIQAQDQLRKGDKTGTPLHFIYEAADCRLFYTAETWKFPRPAWRAAWDAFTDDTKCVEGSTGHKTSISGGFKPYGAETLKEEDYPKSNGNANNEGPENPSEGNGTPEGAAASIKVGSTAFLIVVAAVAALL